MQGITWRLGYGIDDPEEPEGTPLLPPLLATPELILILNRVAGSSCGSQFAANGSHVGPCVFCLLYVGYISASVNKPVAIWETVVREVFEGAVLVQ